MKYFNNSQDETFTEKQTKRFLKVIKNQKYECYFKLIMTYQLSRMELISLEWKDIDFENNTISICPVSYVRNTKFYYSWNIQKLTENKRTMPLLPSIKKLLLKLKQEQVENSINIFLVFSFTIKSCPSPIKIITLREFANYTIQTHFKSRCQYLWQVIISCNVPNIPT